MHLATWRISLLTKEKQMKPTIKELYELCRHIKKYIEDDYLAFEGDDKPGIQLTVGADKDGSWDYQTGDNSFSGGAYLHQYWANVGVYRSSNCLDLAQELRCQLADQMY
jgi:hypothetical protein